MKKIKLNHNYKTDIISPWKMEHIIDNHDEYEFDHYYSSPHGVYAVIMETVFYRTLWDMCRGVNISSKMAPFTLEPLRLAS